MKGLTWPTLAFRKDVEGQSGATQGQCTPSQALSPAPGARWVYFSILIPQALGVNALDSEGMD